MLQRTTSLVFIAVGLLAQHMATSNAQPSPAATPRPVFAPASVFVEGKSLWVHGGADTSSSYNQFFTVDLASSWDASNPKLSMLPPTARPNSHHTASLTKDGDSMIVFSRSSAISRCQLATTQWSTDLTTSQFNDRYQLDAVTDPNTGSIYVPGGYGTQQSMMVYSPDTKVATQDPANYLLQYIGYAAIWSSQRGSVMTFGGNILNESTTIHEYVPGKGWDVVPFYGEAPFSRSNACLVPASNGTKAVLFGGFNNSTYYSDIYVLDQRTMTWTKGPTGSFGGRAMSACGVTGDQFVSWGGYDGTDAIKNDITVIFNLQTMQWQSRFVANTDHTGGPNTGAIIGGVIGGVAALALIVGGFIAYRKRKAQRTPSPATAEDATTLTNGGTGGQEAVKMYDYNQFNLQQPQHMSAYYDAPQPTAGGGFGYAPVASYDARASQDSYRPQQQQHTYSPTATNQTPIIFQPVSSGAELGYIQPHAQYEGDYTSAQTYVPQSMHMGSPTATTYSSSGIASTPTMSVGSHHLADDQHGQVYKVPHNPQTVVPMAPTSQPQAPQFVPSPDARGSVAYE